VEPSGAVGLGALLARKVTLTTDSIAVCIVSGGNVSPEDLSKHIQRF
jgi:threonine dehydratase